MADFHSQIMNIAADASKANEEYSDRRSAYLAGHRDARHAAAELSLASLPPVPQAAAPLTEGELRFIEIVRANPGRKLNSGEAEGPAPVYEPLWKRPQELGLIRAVGSYKWVVHNHTGPVPNAVVDAVGAANATLAAPPAAAEVPAQPLTAAPAEGREALEAARTFVLEASSRYYDGTNGAVRRKEASDCLVLIDSALTATPAPAASAAAPDLERVLSIADEHAEESREDGMRVLDRGGLLQFAKDIIRAYAAAAAVPVPAREEGDAGSHYAINEDAGRQEQAYFDRWAHEDCPIREQLVAPSTARVPAVREVDSWPPSWREHGYNMALTSAAEALRYLANNDRPSGGNSEFNSEWLLMKAGELDTTRKQFATLASTPPASSAEAPAGGAVADKTPIRPTGDELRAIARSARTSASDPASDTELVAAGWEMGYLAGAARAPTADASVAAEVPADERAALTSIVAVIDGGANPGLDTRLNRIAGIARAALAPAFPQAADEPGALREAFLDLYAASEPEWDADDDTGRSASCQGWYVPAPAMREFAEVLGFKSDAEIDRALAVADERAEP